MQIAKEFIGTVASSVIPTNDLLSIVFDPLAWGTVFKAHAKASEAA